MSIGRRNFLKFSGAGLVAAALSPQLAMAKTGQPHVVVAGAGYGGATCAKYLP